MLNKLIDLLQSSEYLVDSTPMLDTTFYLTMS